MYDWEEIRQRYGTLIFSAAYRILKRHDQALDCYQEVFLEALSIAKNVQSAIGRLCCAGLQYDEPWTVCERNVGFPHRLTRRKTPHRYGRRAGVPAMQMEFRELVDRVRGEVARLPERQGEAFWLRCVEQLSTAEVAEQLGTDANSVGVLVHRGGRDCVTCSRMSILPASNNETQARTSYER